MFKTNFRKYLCAVPNTVKQEFVNLNFLILWAISMWAAYFGDPEFALEVMEKAYTIDASSLFFFWTPLGQEARQLPRFKEFIREIGLVDYWNKFGWPEMCRPLDNGDFECDWFEPGTGSKL